MLFNKLLSVALMGIVATSMVACEKKEVQEPTKVEVITETTIKAPEGEQPKEGTVETTTKVVETPVVEGDTNTSIEGQETSVDVVEAPTETVELEEIKTEESK